ncbi:ankyrin repeat domain-containing protein, partial [Acinetobacter stercoris]
GIDDTTSNIDGRTFLMFSVIEKNIEIVKYLLDLNADVNIHDKKGFTALHFAVFAKELEIIKLLVEAGAKIDAIDDQGNTPLWRAMMTTGGDSEISKYLISKEADLDKKNKHGVSPRDLF